MHSRCQPLLGALNVGGLPNRENFDAAGHFKGMVSLATEVAGKKISSEEETFSDISIAIFLGNLEVGVL